MGGALRNTGTGVLFNTNSSSNVLQYVSVPHSPALELSAASIQVRLSPLFQVLNFSYLWGKKAESGVNLLYATLACSPHVPSPRASHCQQAFVKFDSVGGVQGLLSKDTQPDTAQALTLFLSDQLIKLRYISPATTTRATTAASRTVASTTARPTTAASTSRPPTAASTSRPPTTASTSRPPTTRPGTQPPTQPQTQPQTQRQTQPQTQPATTRRRVKRGVSGVLTGQSTVVAGRYYHVVVTCGPQGLQLWIDSVLAGTATAITSCLAANTNALVMGAANWDGPVSTPLRGSLDSVAVADAQVAPDAMLLLTRCALNQSDVACAIVATLTTMVPTATTTASTASTQGPTSSSGFIPAPVNPGRSRDTNLIIVCCEYYLVRKYHYLFVSYVWVLVLDLTQAAVLLIVFFLVCAALCVSVHYSCQGE